MTQAAQADISTCEREPIQIPGSVQPHGALLVIDAATLTILQAAGDTQRFLACAIDILPGAPATRVFTADQVARIESHIKSPGRTDKPHQIFVRTPLGGGLPACVTLHQIDGVLIFEFEASMDEGQADFISIVQDMVRRLQSAANSVAACQTAADEVRAITGFDRVVVYRFLSDGAGVVDAEARRDDITSFLGLRFPAGDIPPQARELYLRNWIRAIPDARYTPSPLVPPINPRTAKPLDMSFCALRSVSPVHLEYLANMNVRASMSLSLILQGRLWGLIACHNEAPMYLPYQRRVALELFTQMASYILETKIAEGELAARVRTSGLHDELVASLSKEDNLVRGLTASQPDLLKFISAEGVVVWMDGQMTQHGEVPSREAIAALVTWLNDSVRDGVYHTNCLPLAYPPAKDFKAVASGMLALSVSRSPKDYVIWFRPEIVETVRWAGRPEKQIEEDQKGIRLSPRKSFAAWEEQMQMHSEPWSNVDIQTAQALRVSLLEVVLHRIDQVAREKELARARQEVLLEELDRRILQWETTARELKIEGDRRALIEAELSQVLRRTVVDQENERRRIARELHDSLGQYLTIMQLEFDQIARSESADPRVVKGIRNLKDLASSVGTEINRLAWEIRPTSLDDLGLQTAVEQLVQEWCERSKLTFDLQLMLNDRRLPPAVETAFYRVLQETINNVVKHANATKVGIILEANENEVSLIVEDDGKGFVWDQMAESSSSRLGLLGMRERLALVGGRIEIESGHEKGTTVIVHAPI